MTPAVNSLCRLPLLTPAAVAAGRVDAASNGVNSSSSSRALGLLLTAALVACAAAPALVGVASPHLASVTAAALRASPVAAVTAAVSAPSRGTLSSAASAAGAGLLAGCLHTLAGPDHLAALTPLTVGRGRMRAALLGALWGGGHSAGQLLLGLAVVGLKGRFEGLMPFLQQWGGPLVGLTLLAIGFTGLWETLGPGEGHHHHRHHHHDGEAGHEASWPMPGGQEYSRGSAHAPSLFPPPPPRPLITSASLQTHVDHEGPLAMRANPDGTVSLALDVAEGEAGAAATVGRWGVRGSQLVTFATGLVYGLQPDALFVVVPALALPTRLAAAAFLVSFTVGTVLAMGGYTFAIGGVAEALHGKTEGKSAVWVSAASGIIAVVVGGLVLGSGMGWISVPFL